MWHLSPDLQNSEMAELARLYYGDVEIAHEDFLAWQYQQNPHGQVIGNVARDNEGHVISQYLLMPKDVWYSGEIIKGSHSLNTLTHPEYAGQGLFTALAQKTYDDCRDKKILFTYITPNRNSAYGFKKKLNFTYVGELDFFVKPIKLHSIFKAKVKSDKIARFLAAVFSPVKFLFQPAKTKQTEIKIKEMHNFSAEYEKFWHEYRMCHTVIGDRSPNLMNWRYFQYPRRAYRLFAAYESEQVVACAVVRVLLLQGLRTGLIVDFMTERSKIGRDGGLELLKNVGNVFCEEDTAIAGTLLKKDVFEAEILREAGYIKCPRRFLPQPFPVSVKIHAKEAEDKLQGLFDWHNWFFTMGDYDVG